MTEANPVNARPLPHVLLIGDSIRQGYQPQVQQRLAGRARVSGPEDNGGDTRNLLAHLDAWVIQPSADIVHINAGLHDIKRQPGSGEPVVAIDEYECNLLALLLRLRTETRARIIWATTTPLDDARHAARKSFGRFHADVLAYNAVALRVAGECGVPVHDLHDVVMRNGGDALLWPDGVHLTDEGYRIVGDAVADFILPMIEEPERIA